EGLLAHPRLHLVAFRPVAHLQVREPEQERHHRPRSRHQLRYQDQHHRRFGFHHGRSTERVAETCSSPLELAYLSERTFGRALELPYWPGPDSTSAEFVPLLQLVPMQKEVWPCSSDWHSRLWRWLLLLSDSPWLQLVSLSRLVTVSAM